MNNQLKMKVNSKNFHLSFCVHKKMKGGKL